MNDAIFHLFADGMESDLFDHRVINELMERMNEEDKLVDNLEVVEMKKEGKKKLLRNEKEKEKGNENKKM